MHTHYTSRVDNQFLHKDGENLHLKLASYLMLDDVLFELTVIPCEGCSISLLVGCSPLGGVGGNRTLSPNKCFFFLTSFPDMNLAVTTKKKCHIYFSAF